MTLTAIAATPTFEASGDRKTTPYARRKGMSATGATPLKNTFGLPAGPAYSCTGATEWCWDDDNPTCYAENLSRLFKGVDALMHRNWNLFQSLKNSTNKLVEALEPMIVEMVRWSEKRGVDPIWRWFWNGDIPNANFALAMEALAIKYPSVQFWAYTRNFGYIDGLTDLPNLTLYLSVDPANVDEAVKVSADNPWFKLAFCADTWQETEAIAARFEGERKGARCPELTGRLPLVVWEDKESRDGKGACAACGLCITGVNNVRFAAGE